MFVDDISKKMLAKGMINFKDIIIQRSIKHTSFI